MNKKISIEFLGMPGSGKTYYQKMIIKKNFFKDYKIITNDFRFLGKKKILYILLFLIKYPIFFLKTMILLISSKEKKDLKKRYFYYFYNEIALWLFFENCKGKCVFINSEGFNYRAVFYFQKKSKRMHLNNYLKIIPKTDIKIVLNSSKKQNITRVNSRKKGYKYSKNDIKNYEKQLRILKKIKIFYKKERKSKLLIFENNKNNANKNLKNLFNYLK